MALDILVPTLFTISASLLTETFTTLFWERKVWYCSLAKDCNSDSGNSFNWLLPVTAFFVQAANKRAVQPKMHRFFSILVSLWILLSNLIPRDAILLALPGL